MKGMARAQDKSSSRKPRQRSEPKAEQPKQNVFECTFCKKRYVREAAFLTHMCAKKKRFIEQDLPHVKLAYQVYRRFWKLSYGRGDRTYEQFAASSVYEEFVRFGRYLRSIHAIEPLEFVDFLVTRKINIRQWDSPALYETYLRDLTARESPDRAVERNLLLIEQWATENNEPIRDFFKKVATTQAVLWIKAGRLSPWVLYTAPSAERLFERLNEEQRAMVHSCIDPKFWEEMIDRHEEEVVHIRSVLEEAGF